jgi:hypothetical protein
MARGRGRSTNPLSIAAAAITRALDPVEPSRVTVLRLLADATRLLDDTIAESGEDDAPESSDQAYARYAFVAGAQAIAAASFTCLMRLGARGGPLRQRAIVLFRRAAAVIKMTAFLSQAAADARSHIAGLKKEPQVAKHEFDAQVASALLVLAEASNPTLAGVDVAKESLLFLFGPKVKALVSRRSDVAIAAAQIMSAHSAGRLPDDRTVDRALEYALASASTKLGVGGVGNALLAASCCPFFTHRTGTSLSESIAASCARALSAAPTNVECNVWAVALARAIVMPKRSAAPASGSPLPTPTSSPPGGARAGRSRLRVRRNPSSLSLSRAAGQADAAARVDADSFSTPSPFEESLMRMASLCADTRSAGFVWGVAAVLRMWAHAAPADCPDIPSRVVALFESSTTSTATLCVLLDAITLGVWEDIKPAEAPRAVVALLSLPASGNLAHALALFLAAELVRTFETDAVSTLSASSRDLGLVLDACQLALAANFSTLRLGGISLVSAVASAAPELRAMLLTVVLQNLRIADLQLATKAPASSADSSSLGAVGAELSGLLGNAAALASLVEELSCQAGPPLAAPAVPSGAIAMTVPAALLVQSASDAEALLVAHPEGTSPEPHGRAAANVRRRAGWALLAALSRAGVPGCFSEARLARLMPLWQAELGQPRARDEDGRLAESQSAASAAGAAPPAPGAGLANFDLSTSSVDMDEVKSASACRSAALTALAACLRVTQSKELKDLAGAMIGATAARISLVDAGIAPLESSPSAFLSLVGAASAGSHADGSSLDLTAAGPAAAATGRPGAGEHDVRRPSRRGVPRANPGSDASAVEHEARRQSRARTVARLCVVESERLLECVQLVSLSGASAELCYHVAAAVGDEAQRTMGDAAGVLASGGSVAPPDSHSLVFSSSPSSRAANGGVMVSRPQGLGRRRCRTRAATERFAADVDALPLGVVDGTGEGRNADGGLAASSARSDPSLSRSPYAGADLAWLFSTDGLEMPLAERALGSASEAVAALIAGDLAVSGSLLESLVSSSTLSPAFSASVALALARRLSASDFNLTGTGRALASLQVLLRRALTGTMALPEIIDSGSSSTSHGGAGSQPRTAADGGGDGGAPDDVPGGALLSQAGRWQEWARSFVFELSTRDGGGQCEESRIMKVAAVVRTLTAEAYRVLGEKGGPTMWLGLTRNVVETMTDGLHSSALSQVSLVANSASVLGTMLDAMPDVTLQPDAAGNSGVFELGAAESAAVREVAQSAVEALSAALEVNDGFVKASASAALSDSSIWVASNSELLLANLVGAWAADEGGSGLSKYRSMFLEEASLATSSLRRAWHGVPDGAGLPFFDFEAQGPGSCVGAFGMGAAAVLTACRLHWWPFGEPCAGAAGEIAFDLVNWDPHTSPRTVAAGLYCLAALWAARIDAIRADGTDDDLISGGSVHSSPKSTGLSQRLPRSSRSPRAQARSSAESRVPPSPLMPSTASRGFLDEFDAELSLHGTSAGGEDLLALSTFDVGDVSCEKTLRRVVSCIRVVGRNECAREVRSAGIAALTQLMRGGGPRAVLDANPSLPEALFTALEGSAAGADLVLEHCARTDGARRLEYWVRLCGAVFFGSDFEGSASPSTASPPQRWTAGCRTRAVAVSVVRLAVEAATSSLDSEFCSERADGRSLPFCAGDIFDLACAACLDVDSSVEAAEEGCKLLRRMVLAVGDASVCCERQDQICTALRHTMRASCRYSVVAQSMAAAASMLSGPCFDKALFATFVGEGKPSELHLVYRYDKFCEDVGAAAAIATLGQIASVVITSQARSTSGDGGGAGDALCSSLQPFLAVLQQLFVAVVADFASVLSEGVAVLAQAGGSLTGPGVVPSCLEATLMKHVGSIALGAAAMSRQGGDGEPAADVPWCNAGAPGALLLAGKLGGGEWERERVVLSVCTWLVNQQAESTAADDEVAVFCDQAASGLSALLCNDRLPAADRIETLLALRALDSNAALQVCRSVGDAESLAADEDMVRSAFAVCMGELTENPGDIDVGLAFRAVSSLLPRLAEGAERTQGAQSVLEVFLFMINLPPSIPLRQVARPAVQAQLVRAVVCGLRLIDDADTLRDVVSKVAALVERMQKIDLSARLDALMAVAASVGSAFPSEVGAAVAGCLGLGDEVADSMLVCAGGPEFILSCLAEDGAVRHVIPVGIVGAVLGALLRRMTLGCGPPRQAAVCLLLQLHGRASTPVLRETLLSSLLPALAKDMDGGRAGAAAALRRLADADSEAFLRTAGWLRVTARGAVADCVE